MKPANHTAIYAATRKFRVTCVDQVMCARGLWLESLVGITESTPSRTPSP